MPAVNLKKIVLIGPASPYRGGIAHFMRATFDGLRKRGHHVQIINFKRQYPALFFPGKTQYDADPSHPTVPSVRLLDAVNVFSWIKTARYICEQQPDLVVFKHWMPFFSPAYGFITRRLTARGIRVLAVVHNALPHEQKPGDRALSRYFFKKCNGFIVMSAAVEQDLRTLGATGKIIRIGHPVYNQFGSLAPQKDARKRLGLKLDAPLLLFFGFVRRYKGLQVLLESMPAVLKSLPDAQLIVAGECYEEEQVYRDFVENNDLKAHVSLRFEYIPDTDIADLFSAADVVVQPYISATQSGVAQVACHFERPLIVTDVGGLAEIVPHEKAGLVVPPENPVALAAAIVRFFKEDMGPVLQQGVLVEKEKYSWDRLFEAVEELGK